MNRDEIKDWIEQWEDRRSEVYPDSAGHPTIGVGFNLDRNDAKEQIEALGLDYDAVRNGTQSLTDAQIDQLFNHDLDTAIAGAREDVSNFDDLPDDKQQVVIDMVFNLGASGFAEFSNTIDAIENNDWSRAADEMENSAWFGQVGDRAEADVNLMRDGLSDDDPPNQNPVPEPEPDPEPEPEPAPAPDPEPNPIPDPEPNPDPEPEPAPTPEPEPEPEPGDNDPGGGDDGGGDEGGEG
jgi:GH24 family phage-related lysozyme (muramidase)